MSSRTKKISLKNQLRECLMQLNAVNMYFKEYDLKRHFMSWIEARKEKKEIPEKLVLKDE